MTTDDMIRVRDAYFKSRNEYISDPEVVAYEAGWLACQRQINAEMQAMVDRMTRAVKEAVEGK